jgi:hypothetical protein
MSALLPKQSLLRFHSQSLSGIKWDISHGSYYAVFLCTWYVHNKASLLEYCIDMADDEEI